MAVDDLPDAPVAVKTARYLPGANALPFTRPVNGTSLWPATAPRKSFATVRSHFLPFLDFFEGFTHLPFAIRPAFFRFISIVTSALWSRP